jgi:hypothetical protein
LLTSLLDVAGNPQHSSRANGNVAMVLSFALTNEEDLAVDVNVVDVERTDFGATNASRV